MKIGMDVDGVLTNLERFYFDYGTRFMKEEGLKTNVVDETGYRLQDLFGIDDKENKKFWEKYLDEYMIKCPIRPFAAEVMNKLIDEGNEVIIITARTLTDTDTKQGERNRKILKKWLKKNKLNYSKIIFSGEEKLGFCRDNKIDVMIEDCPGNIEKISKEIPVICFDAKYNKNISNENVIRCYSFYNIYEQIHELNSK